MKTKNCRVRVKDIKQGITVFVSHPVYGIQELQVMSKPFLHTSVQSLFAKSRKIYDDGFVYDDTFSLCDSGVIPGESYNYRRTFLKLKHAKDWAERMKTDPGFIEQQKAHEQNCKEWNEIEKMFDDYPY